MAEPAYQAKRRELAQKRESAAKLAPSIVSYKPSTVAELLECTERHVQKLIASGELKAYSIGKRGNRVTLQSLQDYINRQTRK